MPGGCKPEPGGWNRIVLEVDDLPTHIEAMKKAGLRFRNEIEKGPGGKRIQAVKNGRSSSGRMKRSLPRGSCS